MAFLVRNSDTLINIKLTDIGRRRLAHGDLKFTKAVVSDREVNYNFNYRYPASWNLNPNAGSEFQLSGNSVIGPKDDHPYLPSISYDGTYVYPLSASVHEKTVITTAQTQSTGMWSAITEGTKEKIGSYLIDLNQCIFSGIMSTSSLVGSDNLTFPVINFLNGYIPNEGELLYLRAPSAVDSGNIIRLSADTNTAYLSNSYAFPSLWYRIQENTGLITRRIDRNSPFSSADLGTNFNVLYTSHRHNAIDTFHGSAATVTTDVWNLTIVRTSREIGWNLKAVGENSGYTYVNYESAGYNGTKMYFGFRDDIRQVGFIHYSNEFTGQTYWDGFVPGTLELDLPDLMWHRTRNENDKFYFSGIAMSTGHRFTDYESKIYYDDIANTRYTLLKDRPSGNTLTVGRVYFDLKMIIITDPELLTSMTYKSNRNWTLPKPRISSLPNPKPPFSVTQKTGFMKSGFNYYVTYLTYMGEELSNYNEGRNVGLQQTIPCQYIQKISGYTNENGQPQHLGFKLPAGNFPYMRKTEDFEALSGTGWGCTAVQILVQEVPEDKDSNIDGLHPAKWSGCSVLMDTFPLNEPSGVFAGDSSSGNRIIDQLILTESDFIVSLSDIQTGTTLSNFSTGDTQNIYTAPSALTSNLDFKNNGLTLGSEYFLNGNVKVVKRKELIEGYMTLVIADANLNTSNNTTYNDFENDTTYITEIGILNDENELVAIGKPNYPITKKEMQWIVLQLKLEF